RKIPNNAEINPKKKAEKSCLVSIIACFDIWNCFGFRAWDFGFAAQKAVRRPSRNQIPLIDETSLPALKANGSTSRSGQPVQCEEFLFHPAASLPGRVHTLSRRRPGYGRQRPKSRSGG